MNDARTVSLMSPEKSQPASPPRRPCGGQDARRQQATAHELALSAAVPATIGTAQFLGAAQPHGSRLGAQPLPVAEHPGLPVSRRQQVDLLMDFRRRFRWGRLVIGFRFRRTSFTRAPSRTIHSSHSATRRATANSQLPKALPGLTFARDARTRKVA